MSAFNVGSSLRKAIQAARAVNDLQRKRKQRLAELAHPCPFCSGTRAVQASSPPCCPSHSLTLSTTALQVTLMMSTSDVFT